MKKCSKHLLLTLNRRLTLVCSTNNSIIITQNISLRIVHTTQYIAADPCEDLPDGEHVLQNEEHLVVKTGEAGRFQPGDEILAVPRHVCPTIALHKAAYVVSGGQVTDQWAVVARDRWLTL